MFYHFKNTRVYGLWFQRRFLICFFSYYKRIADPRGMIGRIYKGNYYPLLYTKYKSPGLCDFREEDFMAFLL